MMTYQVIPGMTWTVGVWALPPTLTITAMPLGEDLVTCHFRGYPTKESMLIVSCMVGVGSF